MIDLDARFLSYLLWGIGTVVVYGLVLRRGLMSWRARGDERSRRELMERTARFMVALASLASLTLVLFGEPGTSVRAIIVALALGAFTAAGLLELWDEPTDPVLDDTEGHWKR